MGTLFVLVRPDIPDVLARRVEEVYEREGYNSKTEFINDSIRRRLEQIEDE